MVRDNDTHFGIDSMKYEDGSFGSRHSFLNFKARWKWTSYILVLLVHIYHGGHSYIYEKRLIHNILIYGEDFGAWIHRLEQDPPQLVSWLCGGQLRVSVVSFIFSHENKSEEECNGALT